MASPAPRLLDHQKRKPSKAEQTAAPEIRRLDLEGPEQGHWIEYRTTMTGKQTITMLRAGEDFASALEVVAERITAHSFGGDILDQDIKVLVRIVQRWNREQEDLSLDPTSADA